jgi:hypothetical protein
MPFTIRPDAAQAMQEDEAQLISAIAQVAQRVPAILKLAANNSASNARGDSLRIKMGRRLVYGQLANGPFRHELDANSLKVIADALQRPATLDVDPEKYVNKVPAIEIFQGDILLFREERDGTVTTNEIQFQVEQEGQPAQKNQLEQKAQPSPETKTPQASAPVAEVPLDKETNPDVRQNSTKNTFSVNKADHILRTAEYLINPLRETLGMYDAVSVSGYQIKQSDQHITVSQGERLILVARGGEVMSDQVTGQDWAALSQIQIPERFPKPDKEAVSQPQVTSPQPAFSPQPALEIVEPPHIKNGIVPAETQIVEPNSVVEATNQQPVALSVLEREIQKLPESPTRKLLQATFQDWQQQAAPWLSTQLEKGMNWLKAQQATLQNQRLASAVKRLFERGYERTGEHSYQVRGCTINREGQNLYVLKDAAGELMKFKTSKILGLGRRLEVISVSDRLTHDQRHSLLSAQFNPTIAPQSSLDIEAVYAKKTRQVETVTRQFLKDFAYANVWSKENGQFKLEVGQGDLLRITDKRNGRGVIFQRQNGEVFSKLGSQDFAHFEKLAGRMQEMASSQDQAGQGETGQRDNGQSKPPTNNAKKVTAIEMD